MIDNKTSFIEQLKQNPLLFSVIGLLISDTSTKIAEFISIPARVVSIFGLLLTLIPLVWWGYIWLNKRKK